MSTAAYVQSKRVENLHLTRERDRRRGRELAWILPGAAAVLLWQTRPLSRAGEQR